MYNVVLLPHIASQIYFQRSHVDSLKTALVEKIASLKWINATNQIYHSKESIFRNILTHHTQEKIFIKIA